MVLIYSTNGRCLFVNTKGGMGIIRSGRCDCLHHVLKLLIFFLLVFVVKSLPSSSPFFMAQRRQFTVPASISEPVVKNTQTRKPSF